MSPPAESVEGLCIRARRLSGIRGRRPLLAASRWAWW